MKKEKLIVLLLLITVLSCTTAKKIEAKDDKVASLKTTYPYWVKAYVLPNRKVFKLSEVKTCDIMVKNLGTKELILPEKLLSYNYEYTFKTYRKEDSSNNFKLYYPKKDGGIILNPGFNIDDYNPKKALTFSSNGKKIIYNNIPLYKTSIINEGVYRTEYTLDFSMFGYFKKIRVDAIFEVVSDTSTQTKPVYYDIKNPDWGSDFLFENYRKLDKGNK